MMSSYPPQDETDFTPGQRHEWVNVGTGKVRKPTHLPHRLGPERKKRIRIQDILRPRLIEPIPHPNLLGRLVNFFKRLINRLLS